MCLMSERQYFEFSTIPEIFTGERKKEHCKTFLVFPCSVQYQQYSYTKIKYLNHV